MPEEWTYTLARPSRRITRGCFIFGEGVCRSQGTQTYSIAPDDASSFTVRSNSLDMTPREATSSTYVIPGHEQDSACPDAEAPER